MNRHLVLKSINDALTKGGRELTLNLRPKEGTVAAVGRQAELMLIELEVIESEEMMNEIIAKLPNLEHLSISGGQIKVLLPKITELTRLQSLAIRSSHLEEVPDEVFKLTALQHLDLSNNQLREVPYEIVNLTELKHLNLQGNPLPLPPEILRLKDRPEEILNAIAQLATGAKRHLNEAKMILVGEGAVGKTSLVKRLLKEPYDPDERKTEGLEIRA